MRKFVLISLVLSLIALSAGAQNLQDNEYYRKMVDLKAQSEAAFEEGDYPEAKRLAEEAQSYKAQSDEWIATQLSAYRARSSLVRLKDRLTEVSRMNAAERYPNEFTSANELYDQSFAQFYDDDDYIKSLATSRAGFELLRGIEYPALAGLPAFYTVRLMPENRDCLWKISGYDFVYGDPWMWKTLYEANKDKLPESDNPHLILPGMVLSIPSVEGETRSGTWTDGEIR